MRVVLPDGSCRTASAIPYHGVRGGTSGITPRNRAQQTRTPLADGRGSGSSGWAAIGTWGGCSRADLEARLLSRESAAQGKRRRSTEYLSPISLLMLLPGGLEAREARGERKSHFLLSMNYKPPSPAGRLPTLPGQREPLPTSQRPTRWQANPITGMYFCTTMYLMDLSYYHRRPWPTPLT